MLVLWRSRLRGLSLSQVREFDDLQVTCRLSRVADAQLASRQDLRCNGRSVGCAEMLSSFMTRKTEGCNRTVERGKIVRTGDETTEEASKKSELREIFYLMRADSWTSHLGFFRDNRKALERFRVRPCPNNDFNGARFLYFANYQALVDRAEWEWFGQCFRFFLPFLGICFITAISIWEKASASICRASAAPTKNSPIGVRLFVMKMEHGLPIFSPRRNFSVSRSRSPILNRVPEED